MKPYYITTAIPYVNAAPHLGHALEFVQADVLARHHRLRGRPVRFLSGTDDHALKNVLAARRSGLPVDVYVQQAAERFSDLADDLDLSCDDYLRTSSDPRHRPGVEYLWQRCVEAGDFYRHHYSGLYCVGCEQFYDPGALVDGRCPEHNTEPEQVVETNWFFRLSRYRDQIRSLITTGELTINPAAKRNEILSLLDRGLDDFSVSRPAERAGGWGIPVPDDPSQVIYVWWDALTNYITALGVDQHGADYRYWWSGDGERVHVIGKGISRFHAIYWIGLLLSADEPLPTTLHVHDYVTVGGSKLSKSSGNVVDPVKLIDRFGVDALRWWICREVPLLGDAEFTVDRLLNANNTDLAHGVGNLANRTVSLLHRDFDGQLCFVDGPLTGPQWDAATLDSDCAELAGKIDFTLATADFRAATGHIVAVVGTANRLFNAAAPWQLRNDGAADLAHRLLSRVVYACRTITTEIAVFCPSGAARLREQLGEGGRLGPAGPAFARLSADVGASL